MTQNKLNPDSCLIIPVYNEEKVIRGVIEEASKTFSKIVCVNDGSHDDSSYKILETSAELVEHPVNLGQGAALQTGIEYAYQDESTKYFVTFDADGQHRIEDVLKMLEYIRSNEVDIILGSRFLGKAENVSSLKRVVLKAAVIFSNITTGLKLTDAHNGLRVFNRRVASGINITMPDMAHASEIIHRIAERKYVYHEMPVTITYTEYSKSKGQSLMNAINITFDLMLQKVVKK